MKKKISLLLTLSLMFTAPITTFASDYAMSFLYGGTSYQYKNYVERTNDALNAVSPDYFQIDGNGELLVDNMDEDFILQMQNDEIKVTPLLSNYNDRSLGVAAIDNANFFATELADVLNKNNLDGVTVDLNNLTEHEKDGYLQFLETIKANIGSKILNVAVAANPDNIQIGWYGSYDYDRIGEIADNVIVMSFDESYNENSPGPVTSANFVEDTVVTLLEQVPSEKIVLGVSFYGRFWKTDSNEMGTPITNMDINMLVDNYKSDVVYDKDSHNYKATVTIDTNEDKPKIWGGITLDEGIYEVWYEDKNSLIDKKDLVKEYNLKGIAAWSLGQEDATIWNKYEDEELIQVASSLDTSFENDNNMEVIYDDSLNMDIDQEYVSDRIIRSWTSEEDDETGVKTETIIFEVMENDVNEKEQNQNNNISQESNLPIVNDDININGDPNDINRETFDINNDNINSYDYMQDDYMQDKNNLMQDDYMRNSNEKYDKNQLIDDYMQEDYIDENLNDDLRDELLESNEEEGFEEFQNENLNKNTIPSDQYDSNQDTNRKQRNNLPTDTRENKGNNKNMIPYDEYMNDEQTRDRRYSPSGETDYDPMYGIDYVPETEDGETFENRERENRVFENIDRNIDRENQRETELEDTINKSPSQTIIDEVNSPNTNDNIQYPTSDVDSFSSAEYEEGRKRVIAEFYSDSYRQDSKETFLSDNNMDDNLETENAEEEMQRRLNDEKIKTDVGETENRIDTEEKRNAEDDKEEVKNLEDTEENIPAETRTKKDTDEIMDKSITDINSNTEEDLSKEKDTLDKNFISPEPRNGINNKNLIYDENKSEPAIDGPIIEEIEESNTGNNTDSQNEIPINFDDVEIFYFDEDDFDEISNVDEYEQEAVETMKLIDDETDEKEIVTIEDTPVLKDNSETEYVEEAEILESEKIETMDIKNEDEQGTFDIQNEEIEDLETEEDTFDKNQLTPETKDISKDKNSLDPEIETFDKKDNAKPSSFDQPGLSDFDQNSFDQVSEMPELEDVIEVNAEVNNQETMDLKEENPDTFDVIEEDGSEILDIENSETETFDIEQSEEIINPDTFDKNQLTPGTKDIPKDKNSLEPETGTFDKNQLMPETKDLFKDKNSLVPEKNTNDRRDNAKPESFHQDPKINFEQNPLDQTSGVVKFDMFVLEPSTELLEDTIETSANVEGQETLNLEDDNFLTNPETMDIEKNESETFDLNPQDLIDSEMETFDKNKLEPELGTFDKNKLEPDTKDVPKDKNSLVPEINTNDNRDKAKPESFDQGGKSSFDQNPFDQILKVIEFDTFVLEANAELSEDVIETSADVLDMETMDLEENTGTFDLNDENIVAPEIGTFDKNQLLPDTKDIPKDKNSLVPEQGTFDNNNSQQETFDDIETDNFDEDSFHQSTEDNEVTGQPLIDNDYQDAKDYAVENQLIYDDEYASTSYVTRAQAVKAIMDLSNLEILERDSYSFKDIETNRYKDHIETAKFYEVVTINSEYFLPDELIEKGEFVLMLENLFELPNSVNFNSDVIRDVERKDNIQAYNAINKYYDHGIIEIDNNDKFYPENKLVLEEFVKILFNMKDIPTKMVQSYTLSSDLLFDRVFTAK